MEEEITVKQIKENDGAIKPVLVCAVLMPNGEVIFKGKTIGWYEKNKKLIFIKK